MTQQLLHSQRGCCVLKNFEETSNYPRYHRMMLSGVLFKFTIAFAIDREVHLISVFHLPESFDI